MGFSDIHNGVLFICYGYKDLWGIPLLISYPIWFIIILLLDIVIKIFNTFNMFIRWVRK